MLRPLISRSLRGQRGASLIEVLVTVLLLSFAMLAMANMHAMSLKYVKMAEFRGIATELALDLGDRMRANASGAASYVYTATYTPTSSAVTVPTCSNVLVCTPAEIAAIDLAEIRNTVRLAVPGGGLRVERDAANPTVMNVWVIWQDPEGNMASTLLTCPGSITATPQPNCLAMRVAL
ncbi:type IV pilus modification protein PilV [Solimonas sp. SE-A11]|uniref:type IV pilus modification protein PilV n=1 Tax=Solimonas sp. SE-A11 TaxID=3054954 RepID=UPI00259CE7CD|nr:type IV pilus modification protein PilV [Solimonas sp. SE-A11]MDM4770838.1 type IV pilus modification protein PilV [Solimonas sp. SE-A11]